MSKRERRPSALPCSRVTAPPKIFPLALLHQDCPLTAECCIVLHDENLQAKFAYLKAPTPKACPIQHGLIFGSIWRRNNDLLGVNKVTPTMHGSEGDVGWDSPNCERYKVLQVCTAGFASQSGRQAILITPLTSSELGS